MSAKSSDKPTKKSKTKKTSPNLEVTWNTAKSGDGSLQITYTIPFEIIKVNREKAAKDLGQNLDIPGFRKGKAPLNKILEHVPDNTLLEKTLSFILPGALGQTIQKENLELAIYPKFELIKAKEEEDWQVRANTAQMPEVELGNYKEEIKGEARAKSIWTPDKGKKNQEEKKPTREELEQEVIRILHDKVYRTIPITLVEDEVNARTARVIEKIDKMGLELDSYLQSVGKTAQQLRAEYEEQAKKALALDIILNKIAQEENVKIDDTQVEEAIKLTGQNGEINDGELNQHKQLVKSILTRREALNQLVSMIK